MTEKEQTATTYAQHAESEPQEPAEKRKGLTFIGKLGLFIGFPTCVGVLGLYMSYLETFRTEGHKLSIDRDFVMPFLLSLAMTVVIGLQTSGYKENKVKPLVPWPKVKRVKKVVKAKKED